MRRVLPSLCLPTHGCSRAEQAQKRVEVMHPYPHPNPHPYPHPYRYP